MRFSVSSASCFPVDMNKIWNIFSPRVLVNRYVHIKKELIKKSGINLVLSLHPMRVMSTKYFFELLSLEMLDISSIDCPDIVGLFDQRMINEFFRKQSIGKFMSRQKAHVGWRLLNFPNKNRFVNEMKFVLDNLQHNASLFRMSSRCMSKPMRSLIIDLFREKSMKIAIELDAFQYDDLNDYLIELRSFSLIMKSINPAVQVGIALDPAHILQGQAMGKIGMFLNSDYLLDSNERRLKIDSIGQILESGLPVFSIDYNPVEILDRRKFDLGDVERTEEAMDEVVKMHCHPDRNIIHYQNIFCSLQDLFEDTLEEIVVEMNPMDLENPGRDFFRDMKTAIDVFGGTSE